MQGNFINTNYNVNTEIPLNCTGPDQLTSYGLVVGGSTGSSNVNVYGNSFIAGNNSNLENIFEVAQNCSIYSQEGTGLVDFHILRENREDASQDLSFLIPTKRMDKDGKVTRVQIAEDPNYEVFTFSTCESSNCSISADLESNPEGIFFGQGNWTGVSGDVNTNKTVIFNVSIYPSHSIWILFFFFSNIVY